MDNETIESQYFNMTQIENEEELVRISELNKMIAYGAIKIDKDKLREYQFDTMVIYNGDREEAMKLWFHSENKI